MSLKNGVIKGAIYGTPTVRMVVVEDPVANSAICKCYVCGALESYKVSDLKNGKIKACKQCANGVKLNKIYNETFEVTDFVYVKTGTMIKVFVGDVSNKELCAVLSCTKCGAKYLKKTLDIKEKKLGNCRCQAGSPNITQKIIPQAIKKSETTKSKNIKNISGLVTDIEDKRRQFTEYEKRGKFLKVGTQSIVGDKGIHVREDVIATCMECSSTSRFRMSDWKSGKCTCKSCDKLGDNSKNLIKNINWVGYTIRNLKITKTYKHSDGVIKADVTCLLCGATFKFNLVSVLNEPELLCFDCADTKIKMRCLECGEPSITTSQRNLYKIRDEKLLFKCNKCNSTLNANEIRYKHEIETRFNNIRKQYKGLTLSRHIPGREDTAGLIVFEEGYTGRDGNEYHTCMCENHHKFLILNDDEMKHYRHEFCADTRMRAYKPKMK